MTYLAKIGELTLKGSNIQEFENLLRHNTAKCLEGTGSRITLRAGRLYIDCTEEASSKVEFMLKHLVGITGWAKCKTCEKDIEEIKKTVFEIAKLRQTREPKPLRLIPVVQTKAFLLILMKLIVKQQVL